MCVTALSARGGFRGGLDVDERLADAAVDLAAPGNRQLHHAASNRAPQELIRLGEQRPAWDGPQVVPPGRLLPAGLVVHGREREQPAWLCANDHCRGLPPEVAELVVAAETSARHRDIGAVQPVASVALRT